MNGASDGYRGNQYELSPQNEDLATEHKKTAQRLAEEHSISRASVERCARMECRRSGGEAMELPACKAVGAYHPQRDTARPVRCPCPGVL